MEENMSKKKLALYPPPPLCESKQVLFPSTFGPVQFRRSIFWRFLNIKFFL